MHFKLPDGGTTDLMMISAPVFVAKTPEQFLTLLHTVARTDGKQDGDKIAAFFKANPEPTRQGAWLKARPDAGELRHRRLFRRAHVHPDERQGREAKRSSGRPSRSAA